LERFLVSERSAHEATCPKGPTLCPNSDLCGIIERSSIAHHLLSCQFRRIECHMCELSLPLPSLQEHLDTECQEVVAECQLCRAKIVRKNLPRHTELACPSVETECPFAPYGCTERPLRSQVDAHVAENTAQHIRLMANAFHAQQNQINALREQLDAQQAARNEEFVSEPGMLYQFDQQLTSYLNDIRSSNMWNHPNLTYLRTRASPRRAFAVVFFVLFLLKLSLCVLFAHRCALLWTGVRAVKAVVKCVVIVKVCAMVVGKVWRGAAWMRNNGYYAMAVVGLSLLVHFLLLG